MDIFSLVAKECDIDYILKSGKDLSTFGSGGQVKLFEPKSKGELNRIIEYCKAHDIECFLLGGGTNTIIADKLKEDKIVVSTKGINKVEYKDNFLYAECGASIYDVIKCARNNGVGGLEFMLGVPCTIGGMMRMNASAFSSKTSDYLSKIDILNTDCDNIRHNYIKTIHRNEIDFGYRKGVRDIVIGGYFALPKISREESELKAREYIKARRKKQPKAKSVGSVFLNGEVPSGLLIERCGLKGVRIGGAEISRMHSNFIINVDNATTKDFLALVELCQNMVYEKFWIRLKREFVLLN